MSHTTTATLALPAFLAALCCPPGAAQGPGEWRYMYHEGQWDPQASGYTGHNTRSELVDGGLLICDTSTQKGSMRNYGLNWGADPEAGAAVEARVKALSCSQPWGLCIMVADGKHEEAFTLFPDRLLLANARLSADFDASSAFHTYRIEIQGEDIRLFADDRLLIDGTGKFVYPSLAKPPRNRLIFGATGSAVQGEAIFQWVRYRSSRPSAKEDEGPMVASLPGLEVTRGDTIPLIPDVTYRSMFRFRDGRLAVHALRSGDAGKTWTKTNHALSVGAFELPDGEIISLGFATKKVADGVFSIELRRSTDGGKTFAEETAILNIPEGTGGTGDNGAAFEGPCVDHSIVRCRDGSLLAAMYGYFKTDTVLCPSFPPEWKMYKYRTFVVRSTDRGKTWDYRATVVYNPDIGLESFCEADLLTLPGGDILCFMRTGGSQGAKKFTPLYMSVSGDDGKTWGEPRPIADRGVWPNACRMQSGILAVTYGRPDNWLAFSLDDGATWGAHRRFYKGPTSSYNSVEEVEPDTLLVVYDKHELGPDGNLAKGVYGTFFRVRRQ